MGFMLRVTGLVRCPCSGRCLLIGDLHSLLRGFVDSVLCICFDCQGLGLRLGESVRNCLVSGSSNLLAKARHLHLFVVQLVGVVCFHTAHSLFASFILSIDSSSLLLQFLYCSVTVVCAI